jgi:hypothetical protein
MLLFLLNWVGLPVFYFRVYIGREDIHVRLILWTHLRNGQSYGQLVETWSRRDRSDWFIDDHTNYLCDFVR